jgi:WD40 repeat protein/serine/threonine protein kinase
LISQDIPMPLAIRCPHCSTDLTAPAEAEIITCTQCGQAVDPASLTGPHAMPDDLTLRYEADEAPPPNTGAVTTSVHHAQAARSAPERQSRPDATPLAGRYRIVEEISRGGMGIVLRGRDSGLHREVAIKIIRDNQNAIQRARFIKEAQITGQLEHPNIVPVHEFGTDAQGKLFFAMKLVRGRTLASIIAWHRSDAIEATRDYPLSRLVGILVQVCNAVAFAHNRGVIHRDLKPSNVMLGDFGEVMLMDWGLARLGMAGPVGTNTVEDTTRRGGITTGTRLVANSDSSSSRIPGHHTTRITGATRVSAQAETAIVSDPTPGDGSSSAIPTGEVDELASPLDMTRDGAVIGTPVYMPPEQAAGQVSRMDARSDIYSLGAMLYEILTLHPPVTGNDLDEVLANASAGRIQPPQRRAPGRDIPKDLAAVAMKALAHDPAERYASAVAMRRDLDLFLEGRTVSARNDNPVESLLRTMRRHRVAAVFAGLTLVTLIGTGVASYLVNLDMRHQAERDRSASEQARAAAEAAGSEAKKQSELAEQARNQSERQAHLASIALAGEQIANGEFAAARAALDSCPREHRDWAWRRLDFLTAQDLARFTVHHDAITASAVAGTVAATGSADGTVAIHDLASRRTSANLHLHAGVVRCVAVAAGPLVVSGGDDTTVRVWRGGDTAPTALFGCDAAITAVAIDAATGVVVAGGSDGSLRLWNLGGGSDDGRASRLLGRLPDAVSALRLSAGRLTAGAVDGSVVALALADGRTLANARLDGRVLALADDSSRAVISGGKSGPQVWDLVHNSAQSVLRNARDLTSAAFIAGGARIVTGGDDGVARVWEAPTGREVLTLRGHAGRIATVAVRNLNDGACEVLSGGDDTTVRLWDGERRRDIDSLSLGRATTAAAISPDGSRALIGTASGSLTLWNLPERRQLNGLILGRRVRAVAFSSDSRFAAAAGDNGICRIWDTTTGRTQATLLCPPAAIQTIVFSPDGSRLATGSGDGQVRLWSTSDGREIGACRGHSGAIQSLAFTPDGTRLATLGHDGTLRLFTAATGTAERLIDAGPGTALALTADGGAVVGGDRTLTIFDLATGVRRSRLTAHTGSVTRIVTSPDGTRLITAGSDGTVRLHDPASGRCLMTLRDATSPVLEVRLANDGSTLIAITADGTVLGYPASAP